MRYEFPENFLWGCATAAAQIEGAAYEDGKSESIWDRYARTPGNIKDGSNLDVTCDSYHRYQEDIELLKNLNAKTYRFSISWPRIFPDGTGEVNQKGIDYYNKLIDGLIEAGIEPYITLYHWDLPQVLEDKGGWVNRDCVKWFVDYAEIVFNAFGDRVKSWMTINEPICASFFGYGDKFMAPGLNDKTKGYAADHHIFLAHGMAVKKCRELCPDGKIGIVINAQFSEPASDKPEDIKAADLDTAWFSWWFLDPVFKGEYPYEIMETLGDAKPPVQDGDMEIISTPTDFLGLNYYGYHTVKATEEKGKFAEMTTSKYHPMATMPGFVIRPEGIYDILTAVRTRYGNPPVIIAENGVATPDFINDNGEIIDDMRGLYIREHLKAVHQAITEGSDIKGYFSWSLMDNFEWAHGFTQRFGLVYVDYETLKRIPKKTYYWLSEVFEKNGF